MENHSKPICITQHGILKSRQITLSLLLLLLSFISITAQSFQSQPVKEIDIEKIAYLSDSISGEIIGIHEVPGMSVAVAQNGRIVFRKTYGKSDLEMHIDVNDKTIFGLSSVTKQFTAATINLAITLLT